MSYNEELVRRFRNADKSFQESDSFLLGLFELASAHRAIKSQEDIVSSIIEWISNEPMSMYMQDAGHGVVHFQKDDFINELKKKFEID